MFKMLNIPIIDVTPEYLMRRHGADALRIVDVMIDQAIAQGRNNDALELDQVRRGVELRLLHDDQIVA